MIITGHRNIYYFFYVLVFLIILPNIVAINLADTLCWSLSGGKSCLSYQVLHDNWNVTGELRAKDFILIDGDTGMALGTGSPTIGMDGDDIYITDKIEVGNRMEIRSQLQVDNSINTTDITANRITSNNFMTPNNSIQYGIYDDSSNIIFDLNNVAGNNYFSLSTDGAFMNLYSNPNPSIDYLMWTVTETQGDDTYINIYEGGTTHNRFWSSGSVRIGGGASSLCTNLTSEVDCDTPTTGADLVVQDDTWTGGTLFANDSLNVLNNATIYGISNISNITTRPYNSSCSFMGKLGSTGGFIFC